MKKRFLFLIGLIPLTFVIYGQNSFSIQKIDQYLDELGEDKNFSLGIAISKNDTILLEKAFGYANREHQIKNEVNTKFNIASIGKLFTAVSILQLKEQNKIDLEHSIGYYLPEFPNKFIRDSITIHQLLIHASGLPLWFSKDFDKTDKFEYLELEDYLNLYKDIAIDKSKRGKNNYSNTGYILLGYVIEEVSKMSYQDYLNKHIFRPLEMNEAGIWKLTEIIPNVAVGYIRPLNKNDWWKTNYHLNKGSSPAGGAYSSVKDLIKFYNGLISNKLLSEETKQLMFSPKIETAYGKYGYGIGIQGNNGKPIIGHLGGYYGIRGELMLYKESNYMVCILANSDQTDYIDISYFIKTELTGTEKEKEAYKNTTELIKGEKFKQKKLDHGFVKTLGGLSFDETLIQIKGYYFYNIKDYKTAKKYFYLNKLLFPDSKSAMNDFKKMEK